MKAFIRGLFHEKLIIAGFMGAIVGLVIGALASQIASEAFYARGAIPIEVAFLVVVTPIFIGAAGGYFGSALHRWAFSPESA